MSTLGYVMDSMTMVNDAYDDWDMYMEDDGYAAEQEETYEPQEEVTEETVTPLKITIPADTTVPDAPAPDLATTLLVCAGALHTLRDCSVNEAKNIVCNLLNTIRPNIGYSMSLYNLYMLLRNVLCYEAAGNIKEFWTSIEDAALYATQKYEDAMTGPEPEYEYEQDDYDDYLEYKYDYEY